MVIFFIFIVLIISIFQKLAGKKVNMFPKWGKILYKEHLS